MEKKLSKVTYEVVENGINDWRVDELFDGNFANDYECKSQAHAEKVKIKLERRLDSLTAGDRMMPSWMVSKSTFTEDLWV